MDRNGESKLGNTGTVFIIMILTNLHNSQGQGLRRL